MRISLRGFLLVAFVFVLSAAAQNSSSPINVVESKMRFDFDPQVQLVLPITNSSAKQMRANVTLEFLDNEDHVAASGNLDIALEPGNFLNNLFLGNKGLPTKSPSSLATYRLRYRLKPFEPSAFVPMEGIVQLGRIMTNPYQVRTAALPKTRPGTQYFVRARVENPYSGHAYPGVEVAARLQLELASGDDHDAPAPVLHKAKADADGNVLFTFDLPAGRKYDGGEVVVSVARGALLEEEKLDFKYWDQPRFSLMTDKPIYQPGQTVHMRTQAFAPDNSALPDAMVELAITDPENMNAFRQEVKTSRFGIASADWQIPNNLRLGKFQISASLKSGDWYDNTQADQEIKISRYDLPQFTVEATPDLPYYLENQTAKVRVTARYLFGEAVTQGHVRISRLKTREWNYHAQSYQTEEDDLASGELSSNGEYTAEIPLKADFEDFTDSSEKYRDISLAAYVTDASTRRTEQRRFDLRITHQAIHLYLLPLFPEFIGEPAQFYVVASYANGIPAAVDVSLAALKPNAEGRLDEDADHPLEAVALRTVATNSYGVAKVTGVAIPAECLVGNLWPLQETARLRLSAHDSKGATGIDSSFITFIPVSDYLRLRTAKTMYREGNDLEIEVDSNLKDEEIVVEVIGKSEPLKSKIVRLVDGRGSVKFSYDSRFSGMLQIMAYSLSVASKATPGTYARILYPAKQELNLGVDLRKASYKPGEQAIADLSLTTAQGTPIQGAFGAVVFDKAVSERARTDEDFGGRDFGFPNYSWYSDESWAISGISLRDLLAWDNSRPFPDGLDLLAEIMVNRPDQFEWTGQRGNETDIAGGEAYFSLPSALFANIIGKSTEAVNAALESSFKKTGKYPYSPGELSNTLKENGIDFDALHDPWGIHFETNFFSDHNQDVVELKSTGPDKQPNTPDDFSVLQVRRPNYLVAALNASYIKTDDYPRNLDELKATLRKEGIDFDALRDPWGTPYEAVFSLAGPTLAGQHDSLEIRSAGPDRQRNTTDDFAVATMFWPFFGKIGHAIDRVTQNYFVKTGKYIRDYETLRAEMLSNEKIDLDGLRDPWGNQYRYDFMVERNNFVVRVMSSGRDGFFSTVKKPSPDDLILWYSRIQYFQRERTAIDAALAAYFQKTGIFPASMDQLQPVLALAQLSPEELKDPWGRQYFFTFAKQAFYANSVQIKTYSVYPDRPRRITTVVPVTQYVEFMNVMSNGPSEKYKAPFSVAEFSGVMTEQASKDAAPIAAADRTALASGTGGIKGQVTDSSGAVLPGVSIKALGDGRKPYESSTGENGVYVLRNMEAGLYEIHFTHTGFVESVVARVPVRAGSVTDLDAALNIDVTQKVFALNSGMVEASLQTTASCQTCSTVEASSPSSGTAAQKEAPAFTPRVRQYFPETLLWSPEIVTDLQGHARLQFKLADNITTWILSAAASTLDGHTGFLRKEITSFQPFFVEHDPPKALTQGDVVALPVVLRSYMKEPQTVSVEMKPERWFSFLNAPVQKIVVPVGGSVDAIFNLRADSSTKDAKQRVIASNAQTGDAIERTIAVHPDGEEISNTFFDVLGGDRSVAEFEISEHAIRGSSEAVLKLYPNLMAHVVEGARGISIWPGACAEQIASITTANLRTLQLLDKFKQDSSKDPGKTNAELLRQTQGYVRDGYAKLLAYREVDGGFSYWGKGNSDLAVTGHVLRALADAKSYIDVNAKIIGDARDFIMKQQQADGSWLSAHWPDYKPNPDSTLTAYLASALAKANASASGEEKKRTDAGIEKALQYLEKKIDEWKDSYLVANYALAAIATNRKEFQEKARQQLLSIAHDEGSATYWNVEENATPFYGWGYTGRLETTALAVQALSLLAASNDVDGQTARQAHRGLLFLLQGKDRYGAWSSTAATVNVIDAFIAAMPSGRIPGTPSKATLWFNGKPSGLVRIPAPSEITGPVVVALPSSIQNGKNKIEVRRPQDNSPLMAQIVSLHYEPWEYSSATRDSNLKPGETRALKLSVTHDRTRAKVGEPIRCTVKTERIGFQGYGMMLAEIGLPPGADVDRASLDSAMDQNYELKHYDILPDRLVFYIWPKAGGTEFNFVFRPRFRMEALSSPSLLYDYYNPEARSVVVPVKFVIN